MSEATPLLVPSNGPSYASSSHRTRQRNPKRKKTTEKIFQKKSKPDSNDDSDKLNTYSGVFLPTTLNVLSILMFLRFGFIVGQLGILGSLLTLILCYLINLLTTLSVSAIATNGIVRTGGAYYMISRSLGPEFGGSIGLIFYFGQILNAALNVVGLIEPLINNFGENNGTIYSILSEGYWFKIIYSTIILFICLFVSLIGSNLVSKAAVLLFFLLMTSVISIPISALIMPSFLIPSLDSYYSGISWITFKENLLPNFTKHAAGSQLDTIENFADLFGIFFPATAGILAGASMSGSLKNPSRSIPKGTLWGLLLTFFCYSIVIVSLGISVPRDLLYKDVQVIQTINLIKILILLGEFSTSIFSIIMGILGAAEILSAIAKDSIIPGLQIFNNKHSNPIKAILFSWLLIQGFLFANINQIATLITMAFLMTFIVINIACFLLEISAAPNFRPSFDYFNRTTAGLGVIFCFLAMFIVDGISASMIIMCLLILIIFIHYICPPKSWGDVSQTLIYHQVRKYLFKLRQDNVKYWRPQILLLVDNPRTCWNLMHFCNNLKKGGLYIIGHVMVSDNNFEDNFDNYNKENSAWIKLRDFLKLKAFVQFSYASSLPWGIRNIFLGSGLGNMKPNIIVMGFIDLSDFYKEENSNNTLVPNNVEKYNLNFNNQGNISKLILPTDNLTNTVEKKIKITEWVQCIEELLLMKVNVAIAKGFPRLEIPEKDVKSLNDEDKKVIDLYPIQMSAEISEKSGQTILSTNFDTYTLILQLGAILKTVPQWDKTHKLRIIVFVEEMNDIKEEEKRVKELIEILRINAEIKVICFNSGNYSFYDCIVKNKITDKKILKKINKILKNNEWWKKINELRIDNKNLINRKKNKPIQIENNLRISKKNNVNLLNLQKLGVDFKMRTNKLIKNEIFDKNFNDSSSESETESLFFDSDPELGLRNSNLFNERRRRKTFSNLRSPNLNSINSSTVIPSISLDDQRPILSRQSSIHSYSSLRSQVRPNFISQAIPKSKIIDSIGNEPSIMFEQKQDDNEEAHDSVSTSSVEYYESDSESLIEINLNDLTFNDLPAKAQHLILNQLMMKNSKNSSIIFSTLPTPPIGCYKIEQNAIDYVETLDLWCNGLPPILLINSRTMTVTTAL